METSVPWGMEPWERCALGDRRWTEYLAWDRFQLKGTGYLGSRWKGLGRGGGNVWGEGAWRRMQKGHDTKGKGARKETWGVGDNLFQGERQARVSAASMQSRGDAGAPSSLGAKPNSLQVLGPAWKKAGDGRAEQCEDAQFLQRQRCPLAMPVPSSPRDQPTCQEWSESWTSTGRLRFALWLFQVIFKHHVPSRAQLQEIRHSMHQVVFKVLSDVGIWFQNRCNSVTSLTLKNFNLLYILLYF